MDLTLSAMLEMSEVRNQRGRKFRGDFRALFDLQQHDKDHGPAGQRASGPPPALPLYPGPPLGPKELSDWLKSFKSTKTS